MRLRALRLEVSTGAGRAGFDMRFGSGLNVLRAPNNSGKSTAMQSVIYALGLEGMFSARREAPLPHAVTERIALPGGEAPVVSSHVQLELENEHGDSITVQRAIVDQVVDRQLVTVWDHPLITESGASSTRRDYFVRRPGAAARPAGFHNFLADFLGWDLPEVQYFDGSTRPLYLEAIFPLVFVEQKQGWGGVRPRVPTYLGIRDVAKRSVEFILDLSSLDRNRRRSELERRLAEIGDAWTATLTRASLAAESQGGRLVGVPLKPTTWTDSTQPRVVFVIDDEPVSLTNVISDTERELALLPADPPAVAAAADDLSSELGETTSALRSAVARQAALEEALDLAEHERAVLDRQIQATEDDRRRLADVRLLESLGSPAQELHALSAHDCPTCHQPLDDVGLADGEVAMSVEQNLRLLEQRVSALRGMTQVAERNVDALAAAVVAGQERASGLRRQVRAIKESLLQPESVPSIASIELRLTLSRRLDELNSLATTISTAEDALSQLADRADAIRGDLRALESEYSGTDLAKIGAFGDELRRQLQQYGFGSLPVSEVQIPAETLIPGHEGFDLGFDISASDGIRTQWAYYSALARLGADLPSNHPGLLFFDEPGQQEIERPSLRAFMRNAVSLATSGVQVVVATSEELNVLQDGLPHDSDATFTVRDTKLLQPLGEG